MSALRGLMPNLRGPDTRKRRLYAHVILSILLYAAPVWSDKFAQAHKGFKKPPQTKITRLLAQRMISAYKSVSYDAATLLAKLLPLDIAAANRKRVFCKLRSNNNQDEQMQQSEKNIREESMQQAICQ